MSQNARAVALQSVATLAEVDREEIRLALVMTGGSSLAVWMGGVTNEINQLRLASIEGTLSRRVTSQRSADRESEHLPERDTADVYRQLLDFIGGTCRVDVISGTSAGGLNGALMGLAIARQGSSLDSLRNLWAEEGSFSRLLRDPFESDPPSLLKGDAYFLPKLRDALKQLAVGTPTPVEDNPVHLMMTATTLSGNDTATPDDFGSLIIDSDHHALFRFRRGNIGHHLPGCVHVEEREAKDDFAGPDVVARLALAARSTASFPVVFEPSFIPIGPGDATRDRPDMTCHATFRKSRYVLDGGVLMNKPIGPALEAIFDQSAAKQVRRCLAYIVPDPGERVIEEPDSKDEVPTVLRVGLDSLVTLPRNESVASEIASLRKHNSRVKVRRNSRVDLAAAVPDLQATATDVFPAYRDVRIETSVSRILEHIAEGVRDLRASNAGAPLWNLEPLRISLLWARRGYTHDSFPTLEQVRDGQWKWGVQTVDLVAATVMELLRRPLKMTNPRNASLEAVRADVGERLSAAHALLRQERDLKTAWGLTYWRTTAQGALAALDDPTGHAAAIWATDSLGAWVGDPDQLKALSYRFAQILVDGERSIRLLLEAAAPSEAEAAAKLRNLLDRLVPSNATLEKPWKTLMNLVALEVIEALFAPGEADVDQVVDIIQVSGNTPNGFDSRQDALTKIAGIKLGHFAAFYKESWRANDWMWGRLDGAYRMVQAVLSPARLHQLEMKKDEALAEMETMALGLAGSSEREVLDDGSPRGWDSADASAELSFLDDPTSPLPLSLPVCTRSLSRRIQLQILREELPHIASAIERDVLQKAFEPPQARTFAADVRSALPTLPDNPQLAGRRVMRRRKTVPTRQRLAAAEACRLFPQCRVSEEKVSDEMGSDLFAATATKGAAVVASIGQGTRSGIGVLRGAFRFVRGIIITIYILAQNALRGGAFQFGAMITALAVGAIFLSAATLSDGNDGWAMSIGLALVVGGFLWGIISTHAWRAASAFIFTVAVAAAPQLLSSLDSWLTKEGSLSSNSVLARITRFAESNQILFLALALFLGPLIMATYRRSRPLDRLVSTRPILAAVALVTVVVGTVLIVTLAAPRMARLEPSIVDFELAGSAQDVVAILAEWDDEELEKAERVTGWDYAFIVLYVAGLSGGTFIAAAFWRRGKIEPMATGGIWIGRAVFAAGVMDAVENLLIFRFLGVPINGSTLPRGMWLLAMTKFIIVIAAWTFCTVGLAAVPLATWRRLQPRRATQEAGG